MLLLPGSIFVWPGVKTDLKKALKGPLGEVEKLIGSHWIGVG